MKKLWFLVYICILGCISSLPVHANWALPPINVSNIVAIPDQTILPEISVNSNGDAMAVWRQGTASSSTFNDILASLFTKSENRWTAPTRISATVGPGSNGVQNPKVVFNDNNQAIAVWSATFTTLNRTSAQVNYTTQAAKYFNGAWSTSSTIGNSGTNSSGHPRVSLNNHGQAVAAWWSHTNRGTTQIVFSRLFSFDGNWSTRALDPLSVASITSMSIKINNNGQMLLTWHEFNGLRHDFGSIVRNHILVVPGNITDNIGFPTPTAQLLLAGKIQTSVGAVNPAIALNDSGQAVAVWTGISGQSVSSRYLFSRGTWDRIVDIFPSSPTNSTMAAINDAGHMAVVAWNTTANSRPNTIATTKSTFEGNWQLGPQIDTANASGPLVGISNDDNMVVFLSNHITEYGVLASEANFNENVWSMPINISGGFSNRTASQLNFSMNISGAAVAVWRATAINAFNSVVQSAIFTPAPTISSLSLTPNEGPVAGGTEVTITGNYFVEGATTVTFGSMDGTNVNVISPTELTVITPASTVGETQAPVVITTLNSSSNDQVFFTYTDEELAPIVKSITPTAGVIAGGTPVTIEGNFFTAPLSVYFGSNPAVVSTFDANTINATAPADSSGPVSVTVVTDAGRSNTDVTFDFTIGTPAPEITNISPTEGRAAGGTTVDIYGSYLSGTTEVTFGGVAATSFSNISSTHIQAVTPAHIAGLVQVVVTTSLSSTEDIEFEYIDPPLIEELVPAEGPIAGGTLVTIFGENFIDVTGVTFGGNPAAIQGPISATEINVLTPAGSGVVDVIVTTAFGSSMAGTNYTYFNAAPSIVHHGLAPDSGSTSGGTNVTITGDNFIGTTEVIFGGKAAQFEVVSNTQIIARSPNSQGIVAKSPTVDVVVHTAGYPPSNAAQFTYKSGAQSPSITSLDPSSGSIDGGDQVIINGNNLLPSSTPPVVTFSGVPAELTYVSDTSLIAISPFGPVGVVDVLVSTEVGLSNSLPFTYPESEPSITSVTPNLGACGTWIEVSGDFFTEKSRVLIGGRHVKTIFESAILLKAKVPNPTSKGPTVDVQVVTEFGISMNGPETQFTYISKSKLPHHFHVNVKKWKCYKKLKMWWTGTQDKHFVYRIYKGSNLIKQTKAQHSHEFFRKIRSLKNIHRYKIQLVEITSSGEKTSSFSKLKKVHRDKQ